MVDKLKLLLATAIAFAGAYAYYNIADLLGQDVSVLIRFAVLAVALIAAVVIAMTSAQGAQFLEFSKGSRIELRKMVWPSGSETRQTTLIVMIAVIIVALFLWAIDSIVFTVIYDWFLGVDG